MMQPDQPDLFGDDVVVRVSSRTDGTMLDRTKKTPLDEVLANRHAFCEANGVDYLDVVQQNIIYDDEQTYDSIVTVSSVDTTRHTPGIHADALFTRDVGVGLFLPVADCVATVVYDPVMRSLALVHLGRHSTLTGLVRITIDLFERSGSKTSDLLVWMSPSAGRQTYRLNDFDAAEDPSWHDYVDRMPDGFYIDMAGYNRARFMDAGVPKGNIQVSSINTMTGPNYFSHASGDVSGRMAVLAVMR